MNAMSPPTSIAFTWLMVAVLAAIAFALVVVVIKDPAMLLVFGGLIVALLAFGLVAKVGLGAMVSGILGNRIIEFIVLVVVGGLLLWLGRMVEKQLVIIGLVMLSVMMILFPQFVKRILLDRFIGVSVGEPGYVIMGGILYAVAVLMNAYLITPE